MREISEQEQEALLDVLRRHEHELRGYKGVHYVDVGYKFVNGEPTDALAIRVHVGEKQPESALEAAQVLPKEIEQLPVDVIQSRPGLEQNPRDARFDPLEGGIAVRNAQQNIGFGTLGVVVFDGASLDPMGLSNHHVLVRQGGQAGNNIAQPNSTNTNDVIGTLTRWNLNLDCAVCTLNNSRGISRGIVDYPQGVTGLAQPVVGMDVTKSGRTTQTTFGTVDGVSTDEFTMVPDPQNPPPTGEISARGDSGSVWLAVANNNAVGLHFAGETDSNVNAERAWSKRMVNVVSALNISFRNTDIFTPNEDWTFGPYYGGNGFSVFSGLALSLRGAFFADVTGDGRADAIVVNADTVTVRRSNGSGFDPNEDWTGGPYYGSRGTYFADVDGDGRADAIVVNDDTVTVRRSNGSGFDPNEDWTFGSYYGSRGTYFADVTGDGRADAIVVNDDTVTVRRAI
jgi:hypothetical protein